MQPKQNFCKAKKLLTIILFIPLFFPVHPAMASENKEIEYLLSYVADSGCIFIRNGTEHQAKDASEHLEMKYNHVKNRIKSAEAFIDKIASKSSFSGRRYESRCDGVKIPVEDWLKKALASYRASTEK